MYLIDETKVLATWEGFVLEQTKWGKGNVEYTLYKNGQIVEQTVYEKEMKEKVLFIEPLLSVVWKP